MLQDEQLLRYSRHLLLPQMGVEGQLQLLQSSVLIVGLGGLGSAVSLYLAASGVGHLVLLDDDQVELSNLQRQIVHDQSRVGHNKAESAACQLRQLNPDIDLTVCTDRFTSDNAADLLGRVDLIVDCSDNFATRFLLNEQAYQRKIPLVSGAAIGLEGQVSVFDFRRENTPCYACLYPDLEEQSLNCAQSGVIAPLVGVIGTMQALEAMKTLIGMGDNLVGRLLLFDAAHSEWRSLTLPKDPACKICGDGA